MKARVDADDEIEEDGSREMCPVNVDGRESAQTDNGNRVERDHDARCNDNEEQNEHDGIDGVERCHPETQGHERTQVAAHEHKMDAAEQEEDESEILVDGLRCQQAIWQKEDRCPDENIEEDTHQFVYPNEASQFATSSFA